MLKIYNSLTRQKEIFKPIEANKIKIYVCGMTVYDHCHLGHARSMVCFDVIVRFLRSLNFQVKYVRNITDIDDKIIIRAQERGLTIDEITNTYINSMYEDAKALAILSPDLEPRATEHIPNIIKLIERLLANNYAYVSANGDVCYQVDKFKEYGKLSHKDLEGLMAGARVEVVQEKKSPLDFVLWKMAKPNEPQWDSPWGKGRPGWHIECSAMAMDELGENFDIHGGGIDLQFPHHENEIAQSEAATQKPFANYWMHVGMLQVNNAKMAKSVGNFFLIKDVLKKYNPEVIRYFLLNSHYRSPLNYSEDNMQLAERALTRLYQSIKDIEIKDEKYDESWLAKFNEAMSDDFNTPIALSVLFALSHEINKNKSKVLAVTLKKLAGILGLLQSVPETFLQGEIKEGGLDIESLIEKRNAARANKDWAEADKIRQDLLNQGIELEDGANGTTWRKIT